MSKKPKRRHGNHPPKSWNLTELLYAFVGALTQRKQPLIFSEKHDNAAIAEYVAEFVKANKLPATRPHYPKVIVPPGTDHLGNSIPVNAVALPPISGEEAVDAIMELIRRAQPDQTNAIVATVLTILKKQHAVRVKHSTQNRDACQSLLIDAMEQSELLENVIRGNFAMIELRTPANGKG